MRTRSTCVTRGVKDVVIGLRKGSGSAKKAEGEKFKVMEVAAAAKWADVVMMLTPDELQGDIYREHLADNMKKGAAIMFAHGLNVHFNLLEPRADLDVLMIAPKGPGHTVRSEYQRGGGVPCLIAIDKDISGNAHDLGLSYASAIGGGRAGIIETSFRKSARPICSASRSCSAAAWSNSSRPATRRWSKPATRPRWPTSSACTK